MDSSTFVSDSLTKPVKITQVSYASETSPPVVTSTDVLDVDSLYRTISSTSNTEHGFQHQIFSICQGNSWNPLQITQPMLEHIIDAFSAHRINDIAKYFYKRDADTEETLCVPWTETTSGCTRTSLYTIRYPEYKASQDRWALRQTGVYHILDLDSGENVYILLEPTAKSGLREAVQTHLRDHAAEIRRDPMWLHSLLFSTYLPSWRDYLLSIEVEYLPLANSAFANYIEQNLLVGHDDLGTLYRLRYRTQQTPVILEHLTDLLSQMRSYTTGLPGSTITQDIRNAAIHNLSQLERESTNSARTAKYLQGRIQSTINFLSTTLTLRDQVVAKEQNVIMMQQSRTTVEQNNNMIRLNKSAVFITAVTLVYLPSSWLGTFFGMNFFGLDQDDHRIVASSMVWIYIVASILLTGATFVLYYFLLQRDGKLFAQLEPTAKMPQRRAMTFLSRRLTGRKSDGTELSILPV